MVQRVRFDSFVAGDDKTYNLTFTDDGGNAVDISNWTVNFDVFAPDGTQVIDKSVTSHTDATAGETTVKLTSSDTSGLDGNYDAEVSVDKDNGDHVTILRGKLPIEPEL